MRLSCISEFWLFLIVAENCLVLSLSAELYIMDMHCSWFVGVYHAGIYCPEWKIWKISRFVYKHSLRYKILEVEFNSSLLVVFSETVVHRYF